MIADIRLPDGNGIDFSQSWRSKFPRTKIVGYSGHLDEWTIWRVSTGAMDGFVTKTRTGLSELCEVLLAVLAGQRRFCSNFQKCRREMLGRPDCMIHKLSDRELTALHGLVNGLDDRELGDQLGITSFTARKHRQNLMRKFETQSSAKLIAAGVRWGIRPSGSLP